jgi:predicted O-methyltransferase YrrM
MLTTHATADDYARIYEAERVVEYPAVDAFERRMGYVVGRGSLNAAARILACPLKAHAPNWQHGRILYALARNYAFRAAVPGEPFRVLDVGTAKGFSALCLCWAFKDFVVQIYSVDVIDPNARERRNSVDELDGYKTLREFLIPWSETMGICFEQRTGIEWLRASNDRVHVAFIDGKHSSEVVWKEGLLLADRQQSGDLVMFDDVQIPGVAQAVKGLSAYDLEYIDLKPVDRRYAIGVRR